MQRFTVSTDVHTQFVDITDRVQSAVDDAGVNDGVCYVFIPHTTAGITINENWDPDVQRDMLLAIDNYIVPDDINYMHAEGNSPAHIKASMMGNSVNVFVESGRLQLGQWQGIYLCEFDGPRTRKLWVKLS